MTDDDKRKPGEDRRRAWTRRARNDRRSQQNKNWMLPLYLTEARSGDDRRYAIKSPPERITKLPVLPKIFRVRTIYLKVYDMDAARSFYGAFLGLEPRKDGNVWCEFPMGNISFALSLDMEEGGRRKERRSTGSGFAPIFEFADNEIYSYISRAKSLGAIMVADYISDGQGNSVLMKDPFGNEFEISKLHD
jgi:predicted enzyme related to lactoylglutathione lyase